MFISCLTCICFPLMRQGRKPSVDLPILLRSGPPCSITQSETNQVN
jgi:hypothetical protein